MSATEDCQTSCMCIKSSQSFSYKLMTAQLVKTYSGKSCGSDGRVPEDSYFSGVLHYITPQSFQMFHRNILPSFLRVWNLKK